MLDPRALDYVQRGDITGLFRYLGPMQLKECMETLEELLAKNFYPNADRYSAELRAAGIVVERMEVAMGAVLGKNARLIGYEKFQEVYRNKLTKLPITDQIAVKTFWFAGPKPGLSIPTGKAPPVIGARGDWYVTSLSAANLSVVIGGGFTVMKGTIDFSNVNGDKVIKQLAMIGPSIGLSKSPNAGTMASKLPGAAKLMTRFPTLTKILTTTKGETFARDVLEYLFMKSATIRGVIMKYPKVGALIESALGNRGAPGGGGESWPSTAIGILAGDSDSLGSDDFAGPCVCYAITGGAGAGLAASFGTYVLFFGVDKNWSPLSDPTPFVDLMALDRKSKGVAVIASLSMAAELPQLNAGATIFWGELS